MTPRKKKVRIANKEKVARRDEKKKLARDGISKARQALEEGRKRIAQKRTERDELKKRMEAASEDDAKTMKMELDTLENQLGIDETEVKNAEADEAKFKRNEEDADKEDVDDEMVISDDDGYNPDNPLKSTEFDLVDHVARLVRGLAISKRIEAIDLSEEVTLRSTQKAVGYKTGFGKPVIVGEYEVPEIPIYRIRNDIEVGDNLPNVMKWRRGGRDKDEMTEKKWARRDIKDILGIAISVPPGFEGKPENLVRVPSKDEKIELKKQDITPPKPRDVQLLVEWKEAIEIGGEMIAISWESRSTLRRILKDADKVLFEFARKRETAYRKAGGRHSSEERSPSPFRLSSKTPETDDDQEDSELSETEDEEEEEPKKKEKEKKKKKKGEEEKKKKKKKKKGDEDSELSETEDEEEEEEPKKKEKEEKKKKKGEEEKKKKKKRASKL